MADYIRMAIPKKKKVYGKKRIEEYVEIEKILRYKGFGILNSENMYSVTILEGDKAGKSIGKCRTFYHAWVLINIMNQFFPKIKQLLAIGGEENISEACEQIRQAHNATQCIIDEFIF